MDGTLLDDVTEGLAICSITSTSAYSSPSALPAEVLAIIFGKVCVKKDRLAFLCVCRAWRSGCSAVISSLSLPWPLSMPPSPYASKKATSTGIIRQECPSSLVPAGCGTGSEMMPHSEGVSPGKRSNTSKKVPIRSSTSLSVRWLTASLKLFCNVSSLELTVPVPPEALSAVALLTSLKRLTIVLRPPPFSSAPASSSTVQLSSRGAPLGVPQQPRDEKYEAAFVKFVTSCTALEDLTMSMRACRWEHWPLLSGSLISVLADNLRLLETLHIKSPMFSSHGTGPLLSQPHLTSLILPLDLPHLPSDQLSTSRHVSPLPRLKEIQLQPYHQVYRGRGGGQKGHGGPHHWQHRALPHGAEAPSFELPSVLSSLVSLQSLRVAGYSRSALHRAEFMSNPLSSIPNLSPLGNLVALELCSLKELEELPPSLCSLPALSLLRIQDCPALHVLPKELGSLGGSLKELHLHAIGIHNLPGSFMELTQLTHLTLSHLYWLESLPQELGALAQLQALKVVSCKQLPALPPSLPSLVQLDSLVLTYNMFPLPPALFASLVQLSSLTLSLSCPQNLELGPALADIPSLVEFHVTMSDDGAGMSMSGEDITRMIPCGPQLASLKIEDLRSSCYSARPAHVAAADVAGAVLDQGGGAAVPGAPQNAGANPLSLEYSLVHFMHGPYPFFAGLKQLHIKCSWLQFDHASFPSLELLDLVLLCRSGLDSPQESTSIPGGTQRRIGRLRDLLREVFQCQKLHSFSLFTPEAPDVLSAPRGKEGHGALSRALYGSEDAPTAPAGLLSFLLNDIDVIHLF